MDVASPPPDDTAPDCAVLPPDYDDWEDDLPDDYCGTTPNGAYVYWMQDDGVCTQAVRHIDQSDDAALFEEGQQTRERTNSLLEKLRPPRAPVSSAPTVVVPAPVASTPSETFGQVARQQARKRKLAPAPTSSSSMNRIRKRLAARRPPTTVSHGPHGTTVTVTPTPTQNAQAPPIAEHLLESHRVHLPGDAYTGASRQMMARGLSGPTAVESMRMRTAACRVATWLEKYTAQHSSALSQEAHNTIGFAASLALQAVEHAERQRRIWVHQTMTGGSFWNARALAAGNLTNSIVEAVPAAAQDRTFSAASMYLPSTTPSQRARGPLIYQ